MSWWGSGPFDGDGPLDFLDAVAELCDYNAEPYGDSSMAVPTPVQRAAAEQVFAHALAGPEAWAANHRRPDPTVEWQAVTARHRLALSAPGSLASWVTAGLVAARAGMVEDHNSGTALMLQTIPNTNLEPAVQTNLGSHCGYLILLSERFAAAHRGQALMVVQGVADNPEAAIRSWGDGTFQHLTVDGVAAVAAEMRWLLGRWQVDTGR